MNTALGELDLLVPRSFQGRLHQALIMFDRAIAFKDMARNPQDLHMMNT